jgi:translation initiation factor 2 subunit 2
MADDLSDTKATEPMAEEEPLFDGLKKKKKGAKKAVAFDPLDIPPEAQDPPPAREGSGTVTPAGEDGDEFADLKKKKKKGGAKKAFDLEAFERELAAADAADAGGGSDDEAERPVPDHFNEDHPEDGLFNRDAEDVGPAAADGEKSRAQKAAEKKAWLTEPDRDYRYEELLGRFYQALYISHPLLGAAGTGKKRYTLAPPSVHREGNKRSIWANVAEICKKMHRQPEHVIQFLFAELGTSGSVDGQGNLVIKGRFQQKQIENVLRRYIVEYVTCKTCKSPDTLLDKDNRLYFVTCESCGSKRSVSAIKTGFSAQIGRRKAQKTG